MQISTEKINWEEIEAVLAGVAIPLLYIVGKGIKGWFDKRSKDRQDALEAKKVEIEGAKAEVVHHSEDEKLYHDGLRSTTEAAKQMSSILTDVINPLVERVKDLEKDAKAHLGEIHELQKEIYELEKNLRIKDDELANLKIEYNKQEEIIKAQEIRINAQEVRIAELECELLKRIKEENGNPLKS